MYISKVQLKNIRCIDNLVLDLRSRASTNSSLLLLGQRFQIIQGISVAGDMREKLSLPLGQRSRAGHDPVPERSQRAPVVMRQWLSRSYRRTARVTASAREIPGVRVCSASMSRSTWAALPRQMWRSRVSARRAPPLRPAAHHTTSPTVATSTSTATVSTSNSILATSPGVTTSPYGGLDAIPSAQTGSVRPPPHTRPVAAS